MSEEWRVTKSLPKHIEVSSEGRIRQYVDADNYEMMNIRNYSGYPSISYKGRAYAVHRLLAEAFIPNPEGYNVVNFKNGVKGDIRLDNLEWGNHANNFKKGILSDSRKKVYCKELNKVFGSMRSAAYLTGVPQDIIAASIKGQFEVAGLTFCEVTATDEVMDRITFSYISFEDMLEAAKKATDSVHLIELANRAASKIGK